MFGSQSESASPSSIVEYHPSRRSLATPLTSTFKADNSKSRVLQDIPGRSQVDENSDVPNINEEMDHDQGSIDLGNIYTNFIDKKTNDDSTRYYSRPGDSLYDEFERPVLAKGLLDWAGANVVALKNYFSPHQSEKNDGLFSYLAKANMEFVTEILPNTVVQGLVERRQREEKERLTAGKKLKETGEKHYEYEHLAKQQDSIKVANPLHVTLVPTSHGRSPLEEPFWSNTQDEIGHSLTKSGVDKDHSSDILNQKFPPAKRDAAPLIQNRLWTEISSPVQKPSHYQEILKQVPQRVVESRDGYMVPELQQKNQQRYTMKEHRRAEKKHRRSKAVSVY